MRFQASVLEELENGCWFRANLIAENKVIIELKSVEPIRLCSSKTVIDVLKICRNETRPVDKCR